MSSDGRQMLIELEGVRESVYLDAAGFATIGVGHMLTKDELTSGAIIIDGDAVHYRDGLTDELIGKLLTQDLDSFELAVNDYLRVEVTQNQFDALVSFAFNVGPHAFKRSTLLKYLNQGRTTDIPQELRRWIYAGGRTWDGLVHRREKEVERWNA